MRPLDIAQVAQRSGVAASTLRYYEEKGLIASVGRRGLRHAAACSAPSHLECPNFRRYLQSAAGRSKVARTRHAPKRRP